MPIPYMNVPKSPSPGKVLGKTIQLASIVTTGYTAAQAQEATEAAADAANAAQAAAEAATDLSQASESIVESAVEFVFEVVEGLLS